MRSFTDRDEDDRRRLNGGIVAPTVILIGPDGQNAGEVRTSVANAMAREVGLDLVLVSEGNPPVARMMNWSRLKYDENRRRKAMRRVRRSAEMKDIHLRARIDEHDLTVKTGQCARFLTGGHPVRVSVLLRGRERSRGEVAGDVIERLIAGLNGTGVASDESREGAMVSVTIRPTRGLGSTVSGDGDPRG